MKNQAVFLQCTGEIAVSPTATPAFYNLYCQSVLLALKEFGVLNDAQYGHCLGLLQQQAENGRKDTSAWGVDPSDKEVRHAQGQTVPNQQRMEGTTR